MYLRLIDFDTIEQFEPIELFKPSYERTDDRRNKYYGATLTMGGRIMAFPWATSEALSWRGADKVVQQALEQHYAGIEGALQSNYNVSMGSAASRYDFCVFVTFKAKVAKPSKIPTEQHMLSAVGSVEEAFIAVRNALLQSWLYQDKAEKRRRTAERALNNLVERVSERAREAVRYDQRLAALKAELKAEQQVQLDKELGKLRAEPEANIVTQIVLQSAAKWLDQQGQHLAPGVHIDQVLKRTPTEQQPDGWGWER